MARPPVQEARETAQEPGRSAEPQADGGARGNGGVFCEADWERNGPLDVMTSDEYLFCAATFRLYVCDSVYLCWYVLSESGSEPRRPCRVGRHRTPQHTYCACSSGLQRHL